MEHSTDMRLSRRIFLAGSLATTAKVGGIGAMAGLPSKALANPTVAFSGEGASAGPDHGPFSALVKRYSVASADGVVRVRYADWKRSDHGALKAYIATLEAEPANTLTRAAQFAYWVNFYNAKTIDVVLDAYPVRSIRDIRLGAAGIFGRGPWRKKVVTVENTPLSLDDIEHRILRPIWRDPRIHYVVNCASIGCPNLPPEALSARNTGSLMEAGARAYVNHPRGVSLEGSQITASRIYDWFGEDFGGLRGLIPHWRRYAAPGLAQNLGRSVRVAGFAYDWGLNDAK